MQLNALPHAVVVVASVFAVALAAILPTCLYLYVEPRGRLGWGANGDLPQTRRAPALVRITAWATFAVGELALIAVVAVPAACAGLLYLQIKLGAGRFFGISVTAAVAAMAVAQSLLAVRLLPLGVHLLMREARLPKRVARLAKQNAAGSAIVLIAGVLVARAAPWLVHPWLRVALSWAALRPVLAYAAVCLLHAGLLGACARAVASPNR